MFAEFVVYVIVAVIIFAVAYALFQPVGGPKHGISLVLEQMATHQRQVAVSGAFVALTVVGFLGYMLIEPGRMQAATWRYEEIDTERGLHTFATNCTTCHGVQGQGLIGPALTVDELAGRHNWDLSSDNDRKAARKLLVETITGGRPAGPLPEGATRPMPAWSTKQGGPLIDQQIEDLATFLLNPDDEKWQRANEYAAAHGVAGATTEAPPPGAGPSAERGKQLLSAKACISCHRIQGVPGAVGTVGPDLTHLASKTAIAGGAVPLNEENLKKWLKNPPALKPGTGMPNLGLTDDEVQSLTLFLMGLK